MARTIPPFGSFNFGEIKWGGNGLGYQLVKLPPQRCYDADGKARPVIKQAHVKVWRDAGNGRREFVCRQPNAKAARTFIKNYRPLLDRAP